MGRIIVGLILGLLVTAGVCAGGPEGQDNLAAKWERLMNTASKQRRAGKLAEAEELLVIAVKVARQLHPQADYPDGHPIVVQSLGNLGVVLWEQRKADKAEQVLREALGIQRRLVKEGDVRTVAYLDSLARVLWMQWKFAEAEGLLREAVGIQRRLVKGDDLKTAGYLRNLALVLQEQKKFMDAEPLLRESLGMWRRIVKGDHPELINCLEILAKTVWDRGNFAEAETLYREVWDRQGRLIKGDHWAKATTLSNLAGVLRSEGKYVEAEGSIRESLGMWERLIKGDHPDKARSMGYFALLLEDQGNDAGAETLHQKLTFQTLNRDKATVDAVLTALPNARYAHLATHGFFVDSSFRSVFQVDPQLFQMTPRGERIGAAALSPLVMTGLVFAGANKANTPGRGIVTGEALIDLNLSGLDLAVLSACETGLGDVAGGEGTFSLQRAFHLAGTRDVVASLWKVNDQATAALMAEFYRNLWEENKPPVIALQLAQLEIYRHPDRIPELAANFRGDLEVVPGGGEQVLKPDPDGKAHPRLWAAFTLSGPGST